MKTKDTIHFKIVNRDGKMNGSLDAESLQVIERLYNSGKNDLYFERVTEKKARSNQQNKYYWKNVLRIICEHVDGMEGYATRNDSGVFDYSKAHRYLTLRFAIENSRTDLIDTITTYHNGKWFDVAVTSFSFDKMKHSDATQYLKWLENKLIQKIGCGFEMILENE